MDMSREEELVESLGREDSSLAAEIRKRLFGIELVLRIRDLELQAVLRDYDDRELALILKGVPAADLQRAVRMVAEGGAWLDPAVTGRVLAAYRAGPAASGPAGGLGRGTRLSGVFGTPWMRSRSSPTAGRAIRSASSSRSRPQDGWMVKSLCARSGAGSPATTAKS
jgi:hypothetical protein